MNNYVSIEGRLTRDPELKYANNGNAVLNIGIAFNSYYKDESGEWKQGKTSFFDAVLFGKKAEDAMLSTGQKVMVIGKLQQDQWEDKDGNKRSRVKINASDIIKMETPQRREEEPVDEVPF